jgi:hypothetical protein
MTQPAAEQAPRSTLETRPNASRKLLARKAREKLASQPGEGGVEDAFPCAPSKAMLAAAPAAHSALRVTPSELPVGALEPSEAIAPAVANTTPLPAPTWSDEDEGAFTTQSARRKAAGYRTRGRDVGAQLITVGSIKPNPSTTVAVIVGLVVERGSVRRGELINAMASTTFPHPKARPSDAAWCQGYVAGAIRNGFLCASYDSPHTDGEV